MPGLIAILQLRMFRGASKSFFLLASFFAFSTPASARAIRILPLQGGEDLCFPGKAPPPDAKGRPWFHPEYRPVGWTSGERDWHPHWCGGAIINPETEEAPSCGPREGWGAGFVPWLAPSGLGWTLDLWQVLVHRRQFNLPGPSEGLLGRVRLWATADDIPSFYVNGTQLDQRATGYKAWGFWDVTALVRPGRNVLASHVVQADNDSPCALTYLIEAELTGRVELVLAPVGSDTSLSATLSAAAAESSGEGDGASGPTDSGAASR